MKRRDFSLAALTTLTAAQFPLIGSASAQQLGTIKMMIPANPGGGWDQTGRALGAAMQSAKAVQSVQFDNKGGAAGTIGLTQFVNSAKGDPNAMMVGGMVMVGGIALNKSPVDLTMVTPLARLTSEYEVVVVFRQFTVQVDGRSGEGVQGRPGQDFLERRVCGRHRPHSGGIDCARGRGRPDEGQLRGIEGRRRPDRQYRRRPRQRRRRWPGRVRRTHQERPHARTRGVGRDGESKAFPR